MGASFFNLFCLNPITVSDLCSSASKFVLFFVSTFEKVPARVLAALSDPGILCFVTAFMQRYECLCQLSLERSYNCVSVYVTIDTVCWLYYV